MSVRVLSAIAALAVTITMPVGPSDGSAHAVGRTAAVTPAVAAPSVAKKDLDCDDFPSQAAAQAYFLAHGGPGYDPDDLDGDGNGIACESNPCPCSTSTHPSGGGGGGGTGHTGGSKCTGIPPARGSQPLHKLTAKTTRVSSGKFAVFGTVSSLPNGQLALFKAKGENGHYCLDHKGPTQVDGDYRLTFSGPIGTCYKLVAPATKQRKETVRFVGCIIKG